MLELGIDLSGQEPQKLTPELAGSVDLLITMGCGEACPYVPGEPSSEHTLSLMYSSGGYTTYQTRILCITLSQYVLKGGMQELICIRIFAAMLATQ